MALTEIRFKEVASLAGIDDLGVLLLVDNDEKRQIAIVCDHHMLFQFELRLSNINTDLLIPEALWKVIKANGNASYYEIHITDIKEGIYETLIHDVTNGYDIPLRASDAILLTLISHIPLLIEESLIEKYGVPYQQQTQGISLPLNVLSNSALKMALEIAVKKERYEIASKIKEEMQQRRNSQLP